jgi:hypothetical protein
MIDVHIIEYLRKLQQFFFQTLKTKTNNNIITSAKLHSE